MLKKAIKVLVVDDEGVVRDFLTRLLTLEGIEVKTAEDGFKASEMAKKEKFDLIFLDQRMPKIDGAGTLKKLKKISPHSKYIMMTGYSLNNLLQSVEGEKIDAFITKPFDINEIILILNDYARNRSSEGIITVLVVEATNEISNFFLRSFKDFNVTTVKTGKEALEQVRQKSFSLIFSDIALVDMSGVDLYSRIHEIRPSEEIILVTGDSKKTEAIIKASLYQQIQQIKNIMT